jgi:hypothetical protein
MKHLAEAGTDWRKAIQHYKAAEIPAPEVRSGGHDLATAPSLNYEAAFLRTCCHAGLVGLAGKPDSGVSAEEGQAELIQALFWLREAVRMFRNRDAYRTETGFDPIRNNPEFLSLMNDLERPVRPTAK